jgi:hypothetical protein
MSPLQEVEEPILSGNVVSATPMQQSNGLLHPKGALRGGLAFDAGLFDYASWLCATTTYNAYWDALVGDALPNCRQIEGAFGPLQQHNLNVPSVYVVDFFHNVEVARTALNIDDVDHTYTVATRAPTGFSAWVSDNATFVVGNCTHSLLARNRDALHFETPCPSRAFTIHIEQTAPLLAAGLYDGDVLFTADNGQTTRIPWTVNVLCFSKLPSLVYERNETNGFQMLAGIDVQGGSLTSSVLHGFQAMTEERATVEDDPQSDFNLAISTCAGDFATATSIACTGLRLYFVDVPADTLLLAGFTEDRFTSGETDDFDLYLHFVPAGCADHTCTVLKASSTTATATERILLKTPGAGRFFWALHAWQTEGPSADVRFYHHHITESSSQAMGSLTVDSSVGTTYILNLSWSVAPNGKIFLAVAALNSVCGTDTFPIILDTADLGTTTAAPTTAACRPAQAPCSINQDCCSIKCFKGKCKA